MLPCLRREIFLKVHFFFMHQTWTHRHFCMVYGWGHPSLSLANTLTIRDLFSKMHQVLLDECLLSQQKTSSVRRIPHISNHQLNPFQCHLLWVPQADSSIPFPEVVKQNPVFLDQYRLTVLIRKPDLHPCTVSSARFPIPCSLLMAWAQHFSLSPQYSATSVSFSLSSILANFVFWTLQFRHGHQHFDNRQTSAFLCCCICWIW